MDTIEPKQRASQEEPPPIQQLGLISMDLDITWLNAAVKGQYFKLYLIVDIFSRFIYLRSLGI